ncbi:MAG: hypothetical protein P8Z42_10145 [Anaerolineales bacterium]|jgi:hypothetical protein
MEFLTKLLAVQTQKRVADFIPVLLMMIFYEFDALLIEEAGVRHLNCCFQIVAMGDLLLQTKDVDRFAHNFVFAGFLRFTFLCTRIDIFRYKFWSMNDVQDERVHEKNLPV